MGSIPSLVLWVKESGIAKTLVLVEAMAQIQSLSGECPCATGASIKKKKRVEWRASHFQQFLIAVIVLST